MHMKYYTSTTEFNCGIDLHARQMYVCVMDRQGKKLVHCNIRNNDFEYFLKLVSLCANLGVLRTSALKIKCEQTQSRRERKVTQRKRWDCKVRQGTRRQKH